MLTRVIRHEAAGYLVRHADQRDDEGGLLAVRNDYLPACDIGVDVGLAGACPPRVGERRQGEWGRRRRFISTILPPCLRRTSSLDGLIRRLGAGWMNSLNSPAKRALNRSSAMFDRVSETVYIHDMGFKSQASGNRNNGASSRRAGRSDARKKAEVRCRRASRADAAVGLPPQEEAGHEEQYATHTQWVDQLQDGGQLERIFEHIPHVLFFAKDLQGRNRMCNQALIEHLGLKHKSQLFGKRDAEYHSYYMAEKYRADDMMVIKTRAPLLDIVELFPTRNGLPELHLTQKFPLFDRQHNVVGVCGIIIRLDNPLYSVPPFQELAPVLQYVRVHYADPIYIENLATLIHVSVRQFQRRFREVMHCTPKEYIIKFRILRAADQLANTSLPITTIAIANGFYDHSSFIRHFEKQMKQTPSGYRRLHIRA